MSHLKAERHVLQPSVIIALAVCLTWLLPCAAAQSCSTTVTGSVPLPSVASGFEARLVATGLSIPRGIAFDSAGNLLVVQSGTGIEALTLQDDGGPCVTEKSRRTVLSLPPLNHGLVLSADGNTLYASSPESAWSWAYNASDTSPLDPNAGTTIVTNMTNTDHTTRTLLLSKKAPGMLLVARGSTSNIDPLAKQLSSGHSQIKAFNLTNMTQTYNFDTDGLLMGWGLRNDVGMDEEPSGGGLYAVENGVDQMTRDGVDIHQNNPGEKLNFLGYVDGTPSPNRGGNFGYPVCYGAWDVSVIPRRKGLKVGMQFAIGNNKGPADDEQCQDQYIAPRLVFQAHQAPLDVLFNSDGSLAWITFHGSWDRTVPVGYTLAAVEFANGQPVAPSTSKTAQIDIVSNVNVMNCPGSCFRPVGLAWDSQGRLFFSDDNKGGIYVVTTSDGKPLNAMNRPPPRAGSSKAKPHKGNAARTRHSWLSGFGELLALTICFLVA